MKKQRINFDTSVELYEKFFFITKFILKKSMTEVFNDFVRITVEEHEQNIRNKIV